MATIRGQGWGDNVVKPSGQVDAYIWNQSAGNTGHFQFTYPTSVGSPDAHFSQNPATLRFNPTERTGVTDTNTNMFWQTVDSHGVITGYTDLGFYENYAMILVAQIVIPWAGDYQIVIQHDDGMFFGIGDGPATVTRVSGLQTNSVGQTQTAYKGYTVLGAYNDGILTTDPAVNPGDPYVVNFPQAGTYTLEVDYNNYEHEQILTISPHAGGWRQLAPAGVKFQAVPLAYPGMTWMKNVIAMSRDYWDPTLGTPYAGQIFPHGGNAPGPGQVFPY